MGPALFAGLGAAVAGSIIWAVVAYLTKHQFSLVAILVGGMVGFTISRIRPGSAAAAAAGALLTLLGCALGTFLALIFVAVRDGAHLGTVLGHVSVIAHAYPRSVGGLGIVFWLIAAVIAFANTVGLRHDRQRPVAPGGPVPMSASARAEARNARPAPGGYGTPQAPSEHDSDRADDQAPVEWDLEPVTVQGSTARSPAPETALQSPAPVLSAPLVLSAPPRAAAPYGIAPSAPSPAAAAYGIAPSAPSPAFRDNGPLPAPLPAFRDAGPPSAPMPAFRDAGPPAAPMPAGPPAAPLLPFRDAGPPSAPLPAFRDAGPPSAPLPPFRDAGPPSAPLPAFRDPGPPSAPLPAVGRSAPPSQLFPEIPDPGHPSAPLPAFRDGGPLSAPLPAVPARPMPLPSRAVRARHAAPADSGQPSPGQPAPPARSVDGNTAATLPRRQRPRGRHSRPPE